MVVEQLLITSTVEICIQQLGRVEERVWLPDDALWWLVCAEPLRRAGLSAAVETFSAKVRRKNPKYVTGNGDWW